MQEWDENAAALPDARLVSRWREAPDAVAALASLPALARDEVVLETGRSGSGQGPNGSVRVLERSPERFLLATSSPAPAWLFVLRAFWNHRDVRVDGQRVETVPAQLAFTALLLPAGDHRVLWREQVPGLKLSWLGPALFVLAAVILLGRRRAEAF